MACGGQSAGGGEVPDAHASRLALTFQCAGRSSVGRRDDELEDKRHADHGADGSGLPEQSRSCRSGSRPRWPGGRPRCSWSRCPDKRGSAGGDDRLADGPVGTVSTRSRRWGRCLACRAGSIGAPMARRTGAPSVDELRKALTSAGMPEAAAQGCLCGGTRSIWSAEVARAASHPSRADCERCIIGACCGTSLPPQGT